MPVKKRKSVKKTKRVKTRKPVKKTKRVKKIKDSLPVNLPEVLPEPVIQEVLPQPEPQPIFVKKKSSRFKRFKRFLNKRGTKITLGVITTAITIFIGVMVMRKKPVTKAKIVKGASQIVAKQTGKPVNEVKQMVESAVMTDPKIQSIVTQATSETQTDFDSQPLEPLSKPVKPTGPPPPPPPMPKPGQLNKKHVIVLPKGGKKLPSPNSGYMNELSAKLAGGRTNKTPEELEELIKRNKQPKELSPFEQELSQRVTRKDSAKSKDYILGDSKDHPLNTEQLKQEFRNRKNKIAPLSNTEFEGYFRDTKPSTKFKSLGRSVIASNRMKRDSEARRAASDFTSGIFKNVAKKAVTEELEAKQAQISQQIEQLKRKLETTNNSLRDPEINAGKRDRLNTIKRETEREIDSLISRELDLIRGYNQFGRRRTKKLKNKSLKQLKRDLKKLKKS